LTAAKVRDGVDEAPYDQTESRRAERRLLVVAIRTIRIQEHRPRPVALERAAIDERIRYASADARGNHQTFYPVLRRVVPPKHLLLLAEHTFARAHVVVVHRR